MRDGGIQGVKLLRPGMVGIIQVQELDDVAQREAKSLAAEDQHNAGAIPMGIHPGGAEPARANQAAVFIKPQGSWGDAEVSRQFCDGEQTLGLVRPLHQSVHWFPYTATEALK